MALESLKPIFVDWYQAIHQTILPLTKAQLEEYCIKHGGDVSEFQYNENTGVLLACAIDMFCVIFAPFHFTAPAMRQKGHFGHFG